jgi:formate hydrogenlyase subunit 4
MLSAPSVLSQEPPTSDLVDLANHTLVVSSAELFFTSIVLFVVAAWEHGNLPLQLAETGGIIFALSMCCLFVAAALDQGCYESP